ncbi:MAG: hypothetical protein NT007_06085 [Candidatus Kapabacteria bacterium]|nr:hypothetical protein [Candidatus Kapabacteria bacterium]
MLKIYIILLFISSEFIYSKEVFWDEINSPKDSIIIICMTFNKSNDIFIGYAGHAGISKSSKNGISWDRLLDWVPYNLFIAKNGFIFVSGYNYQSRSGVSRSKDGGKTWDYSGDSAPDDSTGILQWLNPTNFLELSNGMIVTGSNTGHQIYYSTNYGDTWYARGCWDYSWPKGIAFNNFGELFAVSSKDYAIQKSIDTGKTWKYVRKPIDCTTCPDQYVPILFNPKSDCGISSDYSDKVISRDNGNTWVKDTGYLYFNYEPLYRPFALDSMYNFITSGTNWDTTIKDFKYDVRRYKSDLSSFEDISDTMMIRNNDDKPTCIETSPDGYIYVGMQDGRLFRSHQRYISVKEPEPPQPAGIKISPNPVSDIINISQPSEGLKPSEGSLIRIYNMLGEELKNLTQTSGDLTPALSKGEGVRIDVSALPEGVYYVRVGNVSGGIFVVGR